ncbi:MAG TPA: hypothetical protein ENI51_09415 [Candidatus Atribacteria bacterium]|nr:hypothetical protein [Candidatus Atribacteria bacterium]
MSLASVSEYLSIKFITADVSNQNYALSIFKIEVDRIEDAELLKKQKKELLKLYLPKTDSFLVFFNYYYPMPPPQTFGVDEGDKRRGVELSLVEGKK